MLFSQRIRQTIANSFLVIFILMLLNGIVFRHAHKLSSGKIITHAHPYKSSNSNSPFQPNEHSNQELFLLDSVTNAVFVGLTLAVVLAGVKRTQLVFSPSSPTFYLSAAYRAPSFGDFSLRGPPSIQY